MQSLDVLTINEQKQSGDDLVEVIWRAFSYFPRGIWKEVNYVGNVVLEKDLRIETDKYVSGAFLFSHLLRKIRDMRDVYRVEDFLLGVTSNPVIAMYYRLEADTFMRVVNLVHDYVTGDVGIISLFEMEDNIAAKVAAHGLGHNRGLKHHLEPVDLMFEGLLHGKPIRIDGFCQECQHRLTKRTKTAK